MKIKYLHHHLGLGDHFCCNGLVLELVKRWNVDRLFLFCWEHNLKTLKKLYANTKVELIPLKSFSNENKQIQNYFSSKNISIQHNGSIDWETGNSGSYFQLGFNWMQNQCHKQISQNVSCDQCFYLQANVPYEYRFDKFSYCRDIESEQKILQELNPNKEEYIFVAIDDKDRGMVAPSRKCIVDNGVKIIENPKQYNVLDLGLLLENAKELHLMESSIRCMLEANIFNISKPKLYLHAWRGCIWGNNSVHSWNIIWQDCSEQYCDRKYPMYSGQNGTFTDKGFLI
jgi:hypothetical protein